MYDWLETFVVFLMLKSLWTFWCRFGLQETMMEYLMNLKPPLITFYCSAFSVLLTLYFTIQLVSQHLLHWKNPKEQKAILIIVLMAPIYAVVSFVGLYYVKGGEIFFLFLESIKECYEALVSSFIAYIFWLSSTWCRDAYQFSIFFVQVIAKFLALMYSFLNISISKNIVPDGIKGREIHHSFPMTLFQVCLYLCMVSSISIASTLKSLCLLFWQPHVVHLDQRTLRLLKYWTWQFVVIRPVCSILMIALQIIGFYPSWLSWTFTMVLNVSVSLALYSLVVFYHVFAKELAPHNPLAKFLCIKGIVFFCFWQVNATKQKRETVSLYSYVIETVFIRVFWFWNCRE